ncbi:MAG: pseudouridine synthase [Bacteriovoracaceae bacterium]|nr:pseudouridine synthase [Bacteriovoracaceae bacterium]
MIRLQKFLADCGVASRRKSESLIREGLVRVNGEIIKEMGHKVDPQKDIVQVEEKFVHFHDKEKLYFVLNKPRGVITSVTDPEGRKTVMDFIPPLKDRLFPVGRLDYLSEGLIIITNDGDMAHEIMHPSHEVTKVYEVKVFGIVTKEILQKLKDGIKVGRDFLKPTSVRVIGVLQNKSWLEFKLQEGKNREIRKLCEEVGLTIDKLKRVAIAGLSIGHLKPGDFQLYTKKELEKALKEGDKIPLKVLKKTPMKKTVNIADTSSLKTASYSKSADDPTYRSYRKTAYNLTMQRRKEDPFDVKDKRANVKKKLAQKRRARN